MTPWGAPYQPPPPPRRATGKIVAALVGAAAIVAAAVIAAVHFTGGSHATRPASDAALSRMVVQSSDLPADFSVDDSGDNSDNSSFDDASFAACLGLPDSSLASTPTDGVGNAQSPDFRSGEMGVSSSATSYRSEATVRTDTAALSNPKLAACLKSALQTTFASDLPSGGRVTGTDVKILIGTNGGPSNVVATFVMTASIAAAGQTVDLYMSMVFVTGPRIEAEVDFFDIGQPFPADTEKATVEKVAARVARG
jgi:hypothetical protein